MSTSGTVVSVMEFVLSVMEAVGESVVVGGLGGRGGKKRG